MLNELLYGGYLKEDVLPENVALDGKFADTPTGRTVNPGYSLETSWFLRKRKAAGCAQVGYEAVVAAV